MDYTMLAYEFMSKMRQLHRAKTQKSIDEALQGEAFVLHYLAFQTNEAMPGEISSQMNVSSARVAQTLNSIEKKGWITRRIDINDRRRILVNLTPEGKSEADKHVSFVLGLVSDMLKLLGEQDARDYVRITGKLTDIISNTELRPE